MTASSRKVSRCRACDGAFYPEPLLRLENMPAAAQFMPTAATVAEDRGIELAVYQCSCCGLVQLDCAPVHYFREVVRAAAFSPEMGEFRRQQFAGFVADHHLSGRKAIEIGCGRGEYLSLLAEAGLDAHGLEFSAASVQACRQAGLKVHKGFVSGPRTAIAAAPYDAFFFLNFLEHMPRPVQTLRGIQGNLAEGAVGIVEVPNFDMILRHGLLAEFISDHLLYFTRESFVQSLQSSGFEVLDCREIWHDYILSASVRKRAPTNVRLLQNRREDLAQELRQALEPYKGNVAIWGAGHQALTMICLFRLQDHVRYVVDSAPFKQGKLTPASHLPIDAPDRLRTDPVAAIVVMAAAYSDEIAAILRRDYAPALPLLVLRENGLKVVP